MLDDFFINNYFSGINQTLSIEQQTLILNLEKIFRSNLRDDFALLCNIYELYQTCKGSKSIDQDIINNARINKDYRFTELLAKFFGLSERYIYTLLNISGRFIDFVAGDKKYKVPELHEYSISKLQELLPLELDSIKTAFSLGLLTTKSTRAEIRSFVKGLKGGRVNKVIETNQDLSEFPKQEIDSKDIASCSIVFPKDVYEFVTKQVAKSRKYTTLSDYIIALVREKM